MRGEVHTKKYSALQLQKLRDNISMKEIAS